MNKRRTGLEALLLLWMGPYRVRFRWLCDDQGIQGYKDEKFCEMGVMRGSMPPIWRSVVKDDSPACDEAAQNEKTGIRDLTPTSHKPCIISVKQSFHVVQFYPKYINNPTSNKEPRVIFPSFVCAFVCALPASVCVSIRRSIYPYSHSISHHCAILSYIISVSSPVPYHIFPLIVSLYVCIC